MANDSWIGELYGELGEAVTDIREKFEESMWGREVTEPHDWPQAMEPEPEAQPTGMSGEVLPPEPSSSHEPGGWPELEHGTVIEAQAQEAGRDDTARLDWPQGRDAQEPDNPEHDRDTDIDR